MLVFDFENFVDELYSIVLTNADFDGFELFRVNVDVAKKALNNIFTFLKTFDALSRTFWLGCDDVLTLMSVWSYYTFC